MELEFPVQVTTGISIEPEVIWRYFCTAEEVEQKGSTTVKYLILLVFSRPYVLECTQQALVSRACKLLHNYFNFQPSLPFSFWFHTVRKLQREGLVHFILQMTPISIRIDRRRTTAQMYLSWAASCILLLLHRNSKYGQGLSQPCLVLRPLERSGIHNPYLCMLAISPKINDPCFM